LLWNLLLASALWGPDTPLILLDEAIERLATSYYNAVEHFIALLRTLLPIEVNNNSSFHSNGCQIGHFVVSLQYTRHN